MWAEDWELVAQTVDVSLDLLRSDTLLWRANGDLMTDADRVTAEQRILQFWRCP